jgi:hypothetical protein
MRHAMFRLNWPETELLLGQYWGYFSSFTPETAQDSGCQFVGSPTQRLPQVRLTQKFLGSWTASMLIGAAFNLADNSVLAPNVTSGESSEMPQIQIMGSFEQDLYGKAAFYGRPRGFTAQVAGGWQALRYRPAGLPVSAFGQNTYTAVVGCQRDQQYLNAWMIQGSLFIPVIPTTSANLAGTASISTQWNVGQGLQAFGEAVAADQSYMVYQNTGFCSPAGALLFTNLYDRELQRRFTGFIQGQYYFTNEWFLNFVWGMSKAYGIPQDRDPISPAASTSRYGSAGNDATKFWQQYNLTLWYRPITALKFGLQYSYVRTEYLQVFCSAPNTGAPLFLSGHRTNYGENHRLMFAGFFYF